MQEKRIDILDFFRAIAAIFVVLYHYTTRYNELYGHIKVNYILDFKYGCMFVSTFFILSGFLIVRTLEKEKSWFKFILSRFVRLWPTFVIAMTFTSITLYFGGLVFADRVPTIKQYILNLTMFPGYIGSSPIDGAYWTLPVEIIFYGIISATILLKSKNKIKFMCILWSLTSLIVNTLSLTTNSIALRVLKTILITEFSQLFITGIILFILYKEKNWKDKSMYICLAICLVNQYMSLGMEYTVFYIIEVIVFVITVVLRKVNIPNWLNNKAVKFIAKISYPLYLIHQMIGYVIINKLQSLGMVSELYILIPITISVIISYLLNRYIEIPIISKYKLWNNKNKTLYLQ